MAEYRISGIWKVDGVITYYAFHTQIETGVTRATKRSKAEAIAIVETVGNTVTTWVWNYGAAGWNIGEAVHVINGSGGKYLRSNPDNRLTDNLGHLINFDWLTI